MRPRRPLLPPALGLVAAAAGVLGALRRRRRAPLPGGGLRILHLAFEDHRRPGSGGGGIRTHEINRRLVDRHEVTVVTTRYPGARRRVEDGVAYRPLGLPIGYFGSIITYHLATPILVRMSRPDLVVEDFAAPMSSVLVPLWTARPTVAVVQWLFAGETSLRYRVPFHLVERWGVRLHHHFVVASQYMGDEVRELNPRATVDVVYAGVERTRRPPPPPASRRDGGIVYLGRLQTHAKGLDLLLGAVALLDDGDGGPRLTVAGDGPYRRDLEARALALGIGGRVRFPGRVEGDAKWDLLRRAAVLVVPSRFESFGLVVLEAFASGTPVVAFDLPSLRELVLPDCGILVPAFDVAAFAAAIDRVLADPELAAGMGRAGLDRVTRFSWDDAAIAQEKAYLAAAAVDGGRRRSRRWP